jgi:LPS sulfotransferase NodH
MSPAPPGPARSLADTDSHTALGATFPNLRYLWLTRRDKVRQGISWYRALQTSLWRSTDRPSTTAPTPPPVPAFDVEAISRLVQRSIADDQAWQRFFREYGVTPLAVTYEQLAADPAEVGMRIVRGLGLPPPLQPWPPDWQHRRQADASTDDWVRRYRAQVVRPGQAPDSTA